MTTCTVDGCDTKAVARGWCSRHWQRWKKRGTLELTRNRPVLARFHSSVHHDDESGCWLWQGSLYSNGYGRFAVDQIWVLAHRWAYTTFTGPIPEGFEVDHLCRQITCVNPSHLEAVTPAENMRRTRLDVCGKGHPLSGTNLYVRPDGRGRGECRACRLERSRVARREHHPISLDSIAVKLGMTPK